MLRKRFKFQRNIKPKYKNNYNNHITENCAWGLTCKAR